MNSPGGYVPVFEDPSVYPVISLLRASDPQGVLAVEVRKSNSVDSWTTSAHHPAEFLLRLPDNLWAFLLLDDAELLLGLGSSFPTAETTPGLEPVAATTTAEADSFGEHLHEVHLSNHPGWRVLNTGIISAYGSEWGLARLTHQGTTFLRPRLPLNAPVVTARRRSQYDGAKLVFAKLTTELKATVDPDGVYAGVNVNFIRVSEPELVDYYGALFNSTLMRWIYAGYFGALRMRGGYLQVQAPQLRPLPVPPVKGADLRELGAQRRAVEASRTEERIAFVRGLVEILDVAQLRDQDPSWVLPRQRTILSRLEDSEAINLAAFWQPVRQTARDLHVAITPTLEGRVVALAQSSRLVLTGLAAQAITLDASIDSAVYEIFGLSPDHIATIERGAPELPGVADT